MQAIRVPHETASVVRVAGEVDLDTAPDLEATLVEVVTSDAGDLILDLTPTEFLDSTGLGVLVGVHKRLQLAGADLKIICSSRSLLRLFRMTELDSVWHVYTSAENLELDQRV